MDKINIDELKIVASGFNSFKSRVNKLDVNKSNLVPVDLKIIK